SETSFSFSEISHGQKTGTINVSSVTGVLDYNNHIIPKIFPNPCKNKITLSLGKITLVDILSSDGSLKSSIYIKNEETIIDLALYSSGLYFLRTEKKAYKIYKE